MNVPHQFVFSFSLMCHLLLNVLQHGSSATGGRVIIITASHIDERKVSSLMSRQHLESRHAGAYECVDEWNTHNYDRVNVKIVTHASDVCKCLSRYCWDLQLNNGLM